MKKITTTETGGHPLTLDDIGFLQDAQAEIISAICEGISGNNSTTPIIFKGAEITPNGSNFDISEGWIEVLGEVFYVPNQFNIPLPSGLSAAKLYFVEVNISPSPVVYADSSVKNVHKRRQMQLTDGATSTGGVLTVGYNYLVRYERLLASRLKQEDWREVGLSGNGSYNGSWSGNSSYNNEKVFFRKDISNKYEIKGAASIGAWASSDVVLTLPSEARPSKKRGFAVPYNLGDSSGLMEGWAWITILPNGEVWANCDPGGTPALTLYFDGISYSL